MKDWKIVVIIAAASLFLFTRGMGTRPLWEFDEAKHAQVAKEMIIKGELNKTGWDGEKSDWLRKVLETRTGVINHICLFMHKLYACLERL